MSRRKPSMWPDYCSRETLAARLDVAPYYIDQLVKRGLLPPPTVTLGEAPRWRWADVEKYILGVADGAESHADQVDPYLAGIERAAPQEANH
jgi:hypothetical protein